jgi:hypothetical protein
MKRKLLISLVILFNLYLISALPNDANNKIDFTYPTITNYSEVNTNYSLDSGKLEGRDTNTLVTYIQGLFDLVYQPIGNYLTSWLIPDTSNGYLYNDSQYIYFNDSELSTTFYNVSQLSVISGTGVGQLSDIQTYNDVPYNVTEAVSPAFDFRLNFTGVDDFNQIVVRYKSTTGENHILYLQIWDYSTSTWENYHSFGEVTDYNTITMGVFDSSEHISGGVVQIRFYQATNGNPSHTHYFDWVAISKGLGASSGEEVDPLTYHRNESDNRYLIKGGGGNFIGYQETIGGVTYWTEEFVS